MSNLFTWEQTRSKDTVFAARAHVSLQRKLLYLREFSSSNKRVNNPCTRNLAKAKQPTENMDAI